MQAKPELVARFSRTQRIAHWTFTLAFVALTVTGLFLMVRGFSALAAGGTSRLLHRGAAVLLLLAPVYYLLSDFAGLKRLVSDSFHYDADDRRWLKAMPRYVFGKAKGMPSQGRINAGEKLHHAAIILLFFAVAVSGLFLWLGRAALGRELFGWMLVAHDVSMTLMVLLTLGHLYFVFVYGALRGMTTGYVTRAYAKMEHAKWLAQVDAEGRKSA
ncbi:MAG TPA: cytochrome b/b6 domain-containing protein [Symbiobacteriaceae bacterium]|jgi:formate dehydrogenase subunit gamma